jgi:AcrR family transcriptional regulator
VIADDPVSDSGRPSARQPLLKRGRIRQRRPGRPKQQAAADLRTLYLDAALHTFLTRGYERTSIEEIARAAKASKMTLYRQFGSKEDLFRLVVNEAITRTRDSLRFTADEMGSPDEVLLRVVRRLYDGFTNPWMLAVLRLVIAEYERFPELAKELRSHNSELLGSVEDYLRRATESGHLAVPDPRAGAWQLALLASGGVRFLIAEPIADPAKREFWIQSIFVFARNSWRPLPRNLRHAAGKKKTRK